jgi:adenylate cyclase
MLFKFLRIINVQRATVGLCIGAGLLAASLWWQARDAEVTDLSFTLRKLEYKAQDIAAQHGTLAPRDERLVYLGIDSPSYEDRFSEEELAADPTSAALAKDYPWSRVVWAALLDKLVAAGARVVVFDFLFISSGKGDDVFAASLQRNEGHVVLAANWNIAPDGSGAMLLPNDALVGGMKDVDAGLGLVNFLPDGDNVIRRTSARLQVLTSVPRTLWGQTLERAGFEVAPAEKVPPTQPRRFRFGGQPGTYEYHALYEVFVPSMWKANFKDGAFFKDKIVMVGPAAEWTQDYHATPQASRMLGPEVHLNAMAAALNGQFIKETTRGQELGLIVIATLLALGLMIWLEHPWLRVGAIALVNAGWVIGVQGAYNAGWMLITVAPLLAFNTACGLSLVQRFVVTLLEKVRTRAMLERYVSRNVVREILDKSGSFEESLGGVRKDCTMLFSDIRGFTTMTEGADSQALVMQLNEYLSEMVECVFKREGTLDKFIGDAVMAVWGNVQVRTAEQDAVDAVHCAWEMLAALERLNVGWAARGIVPLHIGIGINYGEVIVGNMGSPQRKEFTVIGDAVNLASRLEGVTKEYGLTLVIGESISPLVEKEFVLQPVDLIRVKGKLKPVAVFTVVALRGAAMAEKVEAALRHYGEGMVAYRAGRFEEARAAFKAAQTKATLNRLAAIYIERCEALIAAPPEGVWDGVFVMTKK